MTSLDFSRYSAKQIRAHCQNNDRSLALNPTLHQAYATESHARASRARAQFDEEMRAFRAWRSAFMAPRREAGAVGNDALNMAVRQAQQAAHRLQTTWSALEPFLPQDERDALLSQRVPRG